MTSLDERLYEHYALHANPPESLSGLESRAPYLRRLIQQHFPKSRDARILDLGCGYGALVHFAREAGYEAIEGVDGARVQIEAARHLGIEGVEVGDLLDKLRTSPDGSYDVVIAMDVLEHFDGEKLVEFADAVYRVLAPNGRWIIHVPNAASPFSGMVRYGDLTHRIAFTTDSLRQLLESSAFSSIEFHENDVVIHGWRSMVRAVVWRLIRIALKIYVTVETGSSRGQVFTQNLLAVAHR